MDFMAFFQENRRRLLTWLQEMVRLESPSGDKANVDLCSKYVVAELQALGAGISRFPQSSIGDLTLAELPGKSPPSQEIRTLILAHVDTVWPVGTIREMPYAVKNDKVFGPGSLDMKAGIVMILGALLALQELGTLPLHAVGILLNSFEEIGNTETDSIIREESKRSTHVLCLEPALPGGALKLKRKGRLVVRLEVQGKTAHAGDPARGISAVDELIIQLRTLYRLRSRSLSINTGMVQGGQTINTVPARAWADLDIRFWRSTEEQKIRAFFQKSLPNSPEAQVSWIVRRYTPVMQHTPGSIRLLRRIRRIASTLEIELSAGRTGGGSDASIASSLGIPTIDGLGPDGDGLHAPHEHVLISSLVSRSALLTKLLLEL